VTLSYDERQILAPLQTCLKCTRPFYMWSAICPNCGPGFRAVYTRTPVFTNTEHRLDVNGHVMHDP